MVLVEFEFDLYLVGMEVEFDDVCQYLMLMWVDWLQVLVVVYVGFMVCVEVVEYGDQCVWVVYWFEYVVQFGGCVVLGGDVGLGFFVGVLVW